MARHWAPLKDPNRPETRSRSITTLGSVESQWGQRPMFSVPGPEQPPPEQGSMGTELRSDDIHPTDRRSGADAITEFEISSPLPGVPFHIINAETLSVPPTDAQIRLALGSHAGVADAFIIRDGFSAGVLWFVVRGGADTWWYERLTKAT